MSHHRKDQTISELRAEVDELRGFVQTGREQVSTLRKMQRDIFDIHSPYVDGGRGGPRITLRCGVCDTAEHHTWGPENDEPWPCPTVRAILDLSAFESNRKPTLIHDAVACPCGGTRGWSFDGECEWHCCTCGMPCHAEAVKP